MKEPLVEMVRFAMVAEVEPEGVEAGLVERHGGRQQVVGIDAALPAVEQNDQRIAPVGRGVVGEAEEARAVPGGDDPFVAPGQVAGGALPYLSPAPGPGCENGLHVPVAEQAAGRKFG